MTSNSEGLAGLTTKGCAWMYSPVVAPDALSKISSVLVYTLPGDADDAVLIALYM